ncbi:hypothetical protein MC28_2353 [Bacillus thuringiensis MC28]|nr:hypothetical protein MC28_2353 [Bacillus thuringiensis MC28]
MYCYQSLNGAEFLFYPAVTLPPQNLVKTKKLGGGSTARNSPIGEG